MRYFLALALFCTFIPQLHAAIQVEGLYEIEIEVSDQGRDERKRALRKALSDVFTRLTGSQGLEQFSQMLYVLDNASRYVEQYRYRQEQAATAEPGSIETLPPKLWLWVRFNRKAIHKLLQDEQLPLWGKTRPETIIWLALEDSGERYILDNDDASEYYRLLLSHAQRRAIPVLLPIMDLEDQRNVRVGDIWGGFSASVKQGSVRYAAENSLIGNVFRIADGSWGSRWNLITPQGEQQWSGNGSSQDEVIALGVDGLADVLASIYALKSNHQAVVYQLKISNINSLEDYARVNEYLSSVTMITSFQPHAVAQGYTVYSIDLRSDVEALKQVLALEQRLLPGPVDIVPPAPAPTPVPIEAAPIAPVPADTAVKPLSDDSSNNSNNVPVEDLTTAVKPEVLPIVPPQPVTEILYYRLRQ